MNAILEQFGGGKRRRQETQAGPMPPAPPRFPPSKKLSIEEMGEEAAAYFARVRDLNASNEAMSAEIERQRILIVRLEAEADVREVALAAVTAERDRLQRVIIAMETQSHTIADLVVRWADGIRANLKRPEVPIDMKAMEEAVSSDGELHASSEPREDAHGRPRSV